jgi:RluA family pseudouridine synthase
MAGKKKAGEEQIEPLLVHRLDRDTSGVILVAKNRRTLRMLHETMRSGGMEKTYIACCHGRPGSAEGVIDAGLSRDYESRDGTKVRVDKGGQRAISRYKLEDERHGISRVKINIDTGRTHQIRVHMSHISCPLVGDARYGNESLDKKLFDGAAADLKRLYLHAFRLRFYHPDAGREVIIEAPLPAQFGALWSSLQGSSIQTMRK